MNLFTSTILYIDKYQQQKHYIDIKHDVYGSNACEQTFSSVLTSGLSMKIFCYNPR